MSKILRYHSVSSTQALAKSLISNGVQPGTVVMAEMQTSGRGRLGRRWVSPVGGLYASLILPTAPLLCLKAGIAVTETLIALGVGARLKWPNDVLVGKKKIAGILIETTHTRAIVGIGVNITTAPVPGSTCIAHETSTPILKENLLQLILQNLRDCSKEEVLARYRALSATIGQTVRVETEQGEIVGFATGIDRDGRLLVEEADTVHAITTGDCIHRESDDPP